MLCFSITTTAQNQVCDSTKGYNMLLIGNSFFRPYAEHLDDLAIDAGFSEHNSSVVFRGGKNGQPISFWNDSTTDEHLSIKSILDQGNIDIFGMTSGHDTSNIEDRVEGQRYWINYALMNNPDVTIFIAIPQIDYPEMWDTIVQAYGFNTIQELNTYYVNDIVNKSMIDQLRLEFPNTNIFSIPTTWATVELYQMQIDSLLLDDISLSGPKATSIFTDTKGHQGQIVIETGTLLWLNSIYNVDLSTNSYDTGFETDLHALAQKIADNYDPNYKKCNNVLTNIPKVDHLTTKIYPNPANNIINVEGEEGLEVSFYDLLGKQILSLNNANQINISNLSEGLYIVELKNTNSGNSTFEKLTIKR